MPVQKFRNIEAMKAAAIPDRGIPLEKRMAALFERSAMLAPPIERPKGVFKFRSIEEMQAQRDEWERQRVAAGQSRMIGTDPDRLP